MHERSRKDEENIHDIGTGNYFMLHCIAAHGKRNQGTDETYCAPHV
jgi:hypothetical protein